MEIRNLTTLDEFRRVVQLEKAVWGYTGESDDVVGAPILVVTVKCGGILLGAFDRDEMVGFVYSLPAVRHGRSSQWSHMLGVLPGIRAAGLGTQLKLAQRDRALAMGVDLIEWTFDPLQAPNAHLNFAKLGVVAREYEENIYGSSASPLHGGAPTDRLVAEWWLRREHVERRIAPRAGEAPRARELYDAPQVNATRRTGAWLECVDADVSRAEGRLFLEIPANFGDMLSEQPDVAAAWRLTTRRIFTSYFARGYRAVDFLFDRGATSGRYLLARDEADI